MDQAAAIEVEAAPAPERKTGPAAILTGLGIVFGDLGTSPLYTYQALVGATGGHPSAEDAIGLLSLVVWALISTVSIKYCILVMRADNGGEGGILALMSLVTGGGKRTRGVWLLITMGLFGAALIYGDGIITPRSPSSARSKASTSPPRSSSPTSCRPPWSCWLGCSSCSPRARRPSAASSAR